MINDIRNTYKTTAKLLGDYQKMSVDTLANGYINAVDTDDSRSKDMYFAALFLRFWYKIEQIYQKCKNINGIERDDCATTLANCIITACEYRAWLDPEKHTNAQACINQVIASRGAPAIIYEYNRDKNLINVNLASLDAPYDEDSDDADVTLMDTIEDDDNAIDIVNAKQSAINYIQSYINDNKLIEAIILDTIAFKDCERDVKNTIEFTTTEGETVKRKLENSEFWDRKCVQNLNSLPENYEQYFTDRYNVRADLLNIATENVRKASNAKLYKYLRNTLSGCKSTVSALY